MRSKILIVDDERGIVDMIKSYFQAQYEILTAYNGQEALQKAANGPDLILLDINMPDIDGLTVCQKIRDYITCPILFLTARIESSDKIIGFQAGADDYIVKPFAFEELTARIRSLGRRSGKWEDDNLLTICDISYDCNARLLSGSTGSIRLSGREGRLLEVLLRSFELVIRREVLLSRVWGVDAEVEDCNLDTYIHYLRKRLSYVGSTLALKTIRGVGYTLASS